MYSQVKLGNKLKKGATYKKENLKYAFPSATWEQVKTKCI